MTETVLTSATKEVVIGFDRPFVIIGERINPTGRKELAEEMKNGQFRDRDRGHDRAGRGRRADARRQRRDSPRRRAGDPAPDDPARAVDHGRAALASTRRSSRRSRPACPSTRARHSSTPSPARRSRWSGCCLSSRSTAPRSSRSRTTRQASPRIPTCDSRWRGRSSRGRPTSGSRRRTSSSTRS